MRAESLLRVIAAGLVLIAVFAHASAPGTAWDKPAANLATRITEALGPGPVHLTLRNLSTIPADQVPVIRRLLEGDLKSGGISFTDTEGANAVRVTLSENPAGGLWVAEIVDGNQTRVLMLAVDPAEGNSSAAAKAKIALHREVVVRSSELEWKPTSMGERPDTEILAVAQVGNGLAVLTPEQIAVFWKTAQGWKEQDNTELGTLHAGSRDLHGLVVPAPDGSSFTAFAPGVTCSGSAGTGATGAAVSWSLHCHPSDDPWPVAQSRTDAGSGQAMRAFYNAGRDYFTGVVTPASGVALPPFYAAGELPGRAGGSAVLIGATDGRVLALENGQLKPVSGTRDWGSDFALILSACGTGVQVIVSSSGDETGDSLRAFEVPALEAAAVSDPLMLNGAAMALWPAPDLKSAMVVVRIAQQPGRETGYEVDRVSEACN